MGKRSKQVSDQASATYARSYLVTLGLAFVAVSLIVGMPPGELERVWPEFLLALGFFAGGAALVAWGLTGPTAKMEYWAEVSSRYEASIFLLVVAYPVYLVLRPLYGGR